jgi:hypothetical protein
MKHPETRQAILFNTIQIHRSTRGGKFTLFSTILHLIALYQDFRLAQQEKDYFFNEINDL